jgi:Ca-activated chloride channel family protein
MPKIIELVLDTSSSMSAIIDGKQRKIDAACKLIINSLLPQFKSADSVGIRFFGGQCEMLSAHYTVKKGRLNDLAQYLTTQVPEPRGSTPLALAIRTTTEALQTKKHTEKELYIISDGEETCGGSIEEAVDYARLQGIVCKIHVVSIGELSKTAQEQFDYISSRTGGKHVQIKSSQLQANVMPNSITRFMFTDIDLCSELIDTEYLPKKDDLFENEITCVRDFLMKQNLDINYIPSTVRGPCCKLLIIEYYEDVSGLENLLKAIQCLERCHAETCQILILMNAWNESFYRSLFKPWVIMFKTYGIKCVAVKLDDFTGYKIL